MRIGRIIMGAFYISAGISHFVLTRFYERAVPDYLPEHRAIVLASGVAELAGGAGILIPQTRRAAAWGLVAMLIAVYPANLWMAQHPERFPSIPTWALYARLPLQLPLIAWAWWHTRRASMCSRRIGAITE